MKKLLAFVFLCSVLVAILIATILVSNLNGYCLSRMERLSDTELLELGTDYAFRRYNALARSEAAEPVLGEGYRIYPDFETFITANPDCCRA